MVVPVLRSSLRLDSMKASSQEVDEQPNKKWHFLRRPVLQGFQSQRNEK